MWGCEKTYRVNALAINTCNLWITACILIMRLLMYNSLALHIFFLFILKDFCFILFAFFCIAFKIYYSQQIYDFDISEIHVLLWKQIRWFYFIPTLVVHIILGEPRSNPFRLFFSTMLKSTIQTLRAHSFSVMISQYLRGNSKLFVFT